MRGIIFIWLSDFGPSWPSRLIQTSFVASAAYMEVENIEGKEEIAHDEQCHFFLQYFQVFILIMLQFRSILEVLYHVYC